MQLRNLNYPVVIMRSDGSLMNETYALNHPVETLLCGHCCQRYGRCLPGTLSKSVIIDMAELPAIALVKRSSACPRRQLWHQIGSWRTIVKGLYVDTFGLGGDSEICYQENNLFLSDRRVMPLYPGCAISRPFRVLDNLDDNYWKGHSNRCILFYIKRKTSLVIHATRKKSKHWSECWKTGTESG